MDITIASRDFACAEAGESRFVGEPCRGARVRDDAGE